MKNFVIYLCLCIFALISVQACGPSEQELQQKEQARLDSLERVRLQRIEQARLDSIAAEQRRQAEATRTREEEDTSINFTENGPLSVQVGSWRSQEKAEAEVSKWKNRGFNGAYSVRFGNEEVGDIWYRVRLGRLPDRNEAEKLRVHVREKYQSPSWIDTAL